MPLRELTDLSSLPALKPEFVMRRPAEALPDPLGHPPRILFSPQTLVLSARCRGGCARSDPVRSRDAHL